MRNPYQRKANTTSGQKGPVSVQSQYQNFVEAIVSQAKVYALYQDGWALCATPTGQASLAVWQSKGLAQLLIKDNWANYHIEEIELIPFLEKMIPFIRANGKILSINLTPEGQNILISGDKFILDLKRYLYQLQLSQPEVFNDPRIPHPRKLRMTVFKAHYKDE